MSNNPFDRRIVNALEKPLSSDINWLQSYIDRTARWTAEQRLGRVSPDVAVSAGSPLKLGVTSGFVSDGFMAYATTPATMAIALRRGLGYYVDAADVPTSIGGIAGLDDVAPLKPLVLVADQGIAVPPADGVNPRIDIIEVRDRRELTEAALKLILDPVGGVFTPGTVDKVLAVAADGFVGWVGPADASTEPISHKSGTPAAVPAAPPVTAGYIKVAEIYVAAGVATITPFDVVDSRPLLFPHGQARIVVRGRFTANGGAGTWELTYVNAPPGIRVASTHDGAGGFRFYVFAGNGAVVYSVTGGIANGAIAGMGVGLLPGCNIDDEAAGTVDTVLQGTLSTPAATNGLVQKVGVGQSYLGAILYPTVILTFSSVPSSIPALLTPGQTANVTAVFDIAKL